MKNTKKLYPIFLALTSLILFFILVPSTVSAPSVDDASLKIEETRITTSESAISPDIYDDKIVWQDNRSGRWNIYMYNLSTKEETQISTSGSAGSPDIDGNNIVWIDGRNGENLNHSDPNAGGNDIYMYNLTTKEETRITKSTIPEDGFGYSLGVSIFGDKIIWGGTYYFRVYNLTTQTEAGIDHIRISMIQDFQGNRIVGLNDIDSRPSDIYIYDFSTCNQTQITSNRETYNPAIYGNTVVFAELIYGDLQIETNIHMYDIPTKKETQLSTSGTAYSHHIYDDRILWMDNSIQDEVNYTRNIHMYNISTKKRSSILNTSAFIEGFNGDKIVWVDYRNENDDCLGGDIYMGTLSENESSPALPIANFSAAPISGKAPFKVKFTSICTGAPTTWKWNFGDDTYSTQKNPKHTYKKAGKYTVSLTVKNAKGSNTKTISKYVTVTNK